MTTRRGVRRGVRMGTKRKVGTRRRVGTRRVGTRRVGGTRELESFYKSMLKKIKLKSGGQKGG